MIVTARQLEDLYRASGNNGHVTLPYRARLTPLASDFVRQRKLQLGYSDVNPAAPASAPSGPATAPVPGGCAAGAPAPSLAPELEKTAGTLLWWCDGPCGPAKAALTALGKEQSLRAIDHPADARHTVAAIKQIAAEIKAGRATKAVLLVSAGAVATVYVNRCPSLRGILGTCLDAVEQGVRQVAANVLIIETPYQTLQQVRNLVGRFARGSQQMDEATRQNLKELASCA